MRYLTTTKNLFDKSLFSTQYDVANSTLIEVKENGWIVQGNPGGSPGSNSYSSGWFRPGCTSYDIDNIGMLLDKTGKVTISAYYTVLENNSTTTASIYLYGKKNKDDSVIGMLPDVGIKTRLYMTFDINDGEEGLYYPVFTLNSSKILIEDIQIEYGDTPTDYVPYGYLPMYKGRYKVSDVCQLLDKSQYPATQTVNGVTFTNNGDGTITVNSLNITANAFVQLATHYIAAKNGHKYCGFSGANRDGGYFYVDILNENGAWISAIVNNVYTIPNDNYSLRPTIIAESSKPFGDKTYKPQLFDLTEMFGAGNEPTTVEEFREKFSNELYPYSPYCWARIKRLIYKDDINYIKMK